MKINKNAWSGLLGFFLCIPWSLLAQNTFSVGSNAYININGAAHIVVNQFNLSNTGTITPGTSTLHFRGNGSHSLRSGGTRWYNLSLDKVGGGTVALLDGILIGNNLNFVADGNYLQLDGFDAKMDSTATITGFSDLKYVVTNSTGQLIKKKMTTFTYPIGFNSTSYNPIQLEEHLTYDTIGVRCLEYAYDQGGTGTPMTADVIDASWQITEEVAGGSQLRVFPEWSASDETSGFDRNNSGVAYWSEVFQTWFVAYDSIQTAQGIGPFQIDQYNINKLGIISVMDAAYELTGIAAVRPKVFL